MDPITPPRLLDKGEQETPPSEAIAASVLGEARKPAKPWTVGKATMIGVAVGWTALCLIEQSAVSAKQWWQDRNSASVMAMRAEQAWLVGEGLTVERKITTEKEGDSSNMSMPQTLGGWRPITFLKLLDEAAALTGARLLSREPVIGAAPEMGEGTEGSLADTYRHEEGHARMFAQGLLAAPAPSWQPEAGKLLANRINAAQTIWRASTRQSVLEWKELNWRDRWLAQLRSEAFADAFATLSKARAGKKAYQEEALRRHAMRVIGDLRPKDGPIIFSAFLGAGEPHAVDMASFLVGQFDSSQVAKLDAKGLDELSGKVADASVAWAMARQGAATGFFSQEGKAWWMETVAPGSQSEALWERLKRDSLSREPQAAFGDFEFKAGGLAFKAQGLPPAPMVYGARWRFDGFGGLRGWERAVEKGADGPVARGEMAEFAGSSASEGTGSFMNDKKAAFRAARARDGAVWTHWAMADRMGADMKAESSRAQLLMGDYLGAGLAQKYYSEWTLARPELDKTARLAKARGMSVWQLIETVSGPEPSEPEPKARRPKGL